MSASGNCAAASMSARNARPNRLSAAALARRCASPPLRSERVRVEVRRGGRRLHPPVGHAAERRDPLGEQIDVTLRRIVEGIEQLVQLEEGRAAHVPVRLLHLGLDIEGVGQAGLKDLDRAFANGTGDVEASRMHV